MPTRNSSCSNGKIIGAILVGQTQKAGLMSILLRKQVNVADCIPMLMSDRLNFMDLLPILQEECRPVQRTRIQGTDGYRTVIL